MLNELAEIFREHILLDKTRVDELYERFFTLIIDIGRNIKEHSGRIWAKDKKEYEELWDFMDGNGFILNKDDNPKDVWPIEIRIIYKEGEKDYEEEPLNDLDFPI